MPVYKSNAKINLGLEVLRKRDDGYHDINTIFYKINLYDSITIEPAQELSVTCNPSLGILQEQNLAYKAGKLIQKYYDCKSKAAKIIINKKIPDGAGLGGGSSNAATVMIALNDLWQINAPNYELQKIASLLGSDIPFFFGSQAATGCGKGEILDFFDFILSYNILLVVPDIKVSTEWAYKNIQSLTKNPSNFKDILLNHCNEPHFLKANIINDFEAIVFPVYPELGLIKQQLYENGADFALMSGSGSTIFGLFKDMEQLKKARNNFKQYKTLAV